MFSSQIEKDETVDNFVSKPAQNDRPAPHRPAPPTPQPIRAHPDSNQPIINETNEEQPIIIQEPTIAENKTIEDAVDLLNLNSGPSANVSTPSKVLSSNFDLLGGLDTSGDSSYGEFSSGATPDLLGQPVNNTFANISRNSSQNDFKTNPNNDLLFDPFGDENKNDGLIGGWDGTGANKANVTPPEGQSSKPSSLFSDLGKLPLPFCAIILTKF